MTRAGKGAQFAVEILKAALVGLELKAARVEEQRKEIVARLKGMGVKLGLEVGVGLGARAGAGRQIAKRTGTRRGPKTTDKGKMGSKVRKAKKPRRPLSPEARERIIAAQKKRWAEYHKKATAKGKGKRRPKSSKTPKPAKPSKSRKSGNTPVETAQES